MVLIFVCIEQRFKESGTSLKVRPRPTRELLQMVDPNSGISSSSSSDGTIRPLSIMSTFKAQNQTTIEPLVNNNAYYSQKLEPMMNAAVGLGLQRDKLEAYSPGGARCLILSAADVYSVHDDVAQAFYVTDV